MFFFFKVLMHKDEVKDEKFGGRIEECLIYRMHDSFFSVGNVNGHTVLVRNGRKGIPKENQKYSKKSLVKFDSYRKENRKFPAVNFLTSYVPKNFEGLSRENYVLLGEWEPRMSKVKEFPTIEEIQEYYNPGELILAYYIQEGSSNSYGRMLIIKESVNPIKGRTFGEIIQKGIRRQKGGKSAPLILVEDELELEKMIEKAFELEIYPVVMQALM